MTERDDAVSKRYRELGAEEPPRALDEAILAASRRAAGTRPAPLVAPTGRQRWYVPLAAAAVIVLAVGLTLRVQLEEPAMREVTPPSPTVLQAPAPKDEARAREEPVAKAEAKPAPERRMAQARERHDLGESRAQGPASAPAPFPAQPQPAPATKPDAARGAEPRAIQRAPAAEAPAAPPPAVASAAPQAEDAARDRAEARALASGATAKRLAEAQETPERMLERIAELRRNGKHDEADKALAEFRKRFPDYKLSDEMKAKVERR